ncbi:MAG: sulfite exporter TauE/SafE family protein [Acidimicrobiales bacterium]
MDWTVVLAGAAVGFLVGLTGAGGGALMTPMLIFVFGVSPSAAISSDLVAAMVMRPVGGAVHLRRGTVNLPMVGWLTLGSVPAAFAGAYLLHLMGTGTAAETRVEIVLGAALLLGAGGMVLRAALGRRPGGGVAVRPVPTVAVGAVGGLLVGLTSVGSGSLMIVLLLLLYPTLAASQLVGTDLVQAVPLTAAAALGQLLFGHVVLAVTASLVVGSVPGVFAGSLLSSRAPDRLLRPVITFALFASGLKYVGLGTAALACTLAGTLVVAGAAWAVVRWRRAGRLPAEAG